MAEGTLASEAGGLASFGAVAVVGGDTGVAGVAGAGVPATDLANGSLIGLTGVSTLGADTAGGDVTTGSGFGLATPATDGAGVGVTWLGAKAIGVAGVGIWLSVFGLVELGFVTAGLETRGVARVSWTVFGFVAGFVAGLVIVVAVLGLA